MVSVITLGHSCFNISETEILQAGSLNRIWINQLKKSELIAAAQIIFRCHQFLSSKLNVEPSSNNGNITDAR